MNNKKIISKFKYGFNENVVNITKAVAYRSLVLKNFDQSFLYPKDKKQEKTTEKKNNAIDEVKFIPPRKHDYYKNLRTI